MNKIWEEKVSSLDQAGIQLSLKWIHDEDQVERDEGIWIFSTEGKLDVQPFFKKLPLEERAQLVEMAKKIQIRYIKEVIHNLPESKHRGFKISEAVEEMETFLQPDKAGIFFKEGIPNTPYCQSNWDKAARSTKMKLLSRILNETRERFDRALKRLNDLDYITTNHDFQ